MHSAATIDDFREKLTTVCERERVQKILTSLFARLVNQLVWEVKNHAYLRINTRNAGPQRQPSVRCTHIDNDNVQMET